MRIAAMLMLVTTLSAAADAAVLCAKPERDETLNGSVKVRQACKRNEMQLAPPDVNFYLIRRIPALKWSLWRSRRRFITATRPIPRRNIAERVSGPLGGSGHRPTVATRLTQVHFHDDPRRRSAGGDRGGARLLAVDPGVARLRRGDASRPARPFGAGIRRISPFPSPFANRAAIVPVSARSDQACNSKRAQRRHTDATEPGPQRTSWLLAEPSHAVSRFSGYGLPLVGSFARGRHDGGPPKIPSARRVPGLTG